MKTADEKALHFLANMINGRECRKEGYAMPVRWRCLREDLREKYLKEAAEIVEKWDSEEEEAEQSRKR